MSDRKFQKKLEKIRKRGERYKQEKELRDSYAEYVPEKKKRRFSSIMIVIIVINIIAYVVASFMLQYYTGAEMSPTITTCWFSFWTIEIVALTGIKISKVKNNYDDNSVG